MPALRIVWKSRPSGMPTLSGCNFHSLQLSDFAAFFPALFTEPDIIQLNIEHHLNSAFFSLFYLQFFFPLFSAPNWLPVKCQNRSACNLDLLLLTRTNRQLNVQPKIKETNEWNWRGAGAKNYCPKTRNSNKTKKEKKRKKKHSRPNSNKQMANGKN